MKKFFASFLFLSLALVSFAPGASASTIIDKAINRLGDTSEKAELGRPAGEAGITSLISNGINTVIGILGVVAVLLIVYAGGLWLTAAGNETKVEDAKKIIKSTIIGIIIISMAYAITTFIITLVTPAPSAPTNSNTLPGSQNPLDLPINLDPSPSRDSGGAGDPTSPFSGVDPNDTSRFPDFSG